MIEKQYVNFSECVKDMQAYAKQIKGTVFPLDEKNFLRSKLGWLVIPEGASHDSDAELWFTITIRNLRRRNRK